MRRTVSPITNTASRCSKAGIIGRKLRETGNKQAGAVIESICFNKRNVLGSKEPIVS